MSLSFLAWGAGAALSFSVGVVLVKVAALFGDAGAPLIVGLAIFAAVTGLLLAAPIVGVLAVLATFPVGSVPVPGLPLSVSEAAVLYAATLVALRQLAIARRPFGWAPPMWWAMALLVWVAVVVSSAIDVALATKQLAALGGGIAFASLVLSSSDRTADVRHALLGFVVVATAVVASGFTSGVSFASVAGGTTVGGRLTGALDHPNQLGSLCALAIPIGVALALSPVGAAIRGFSAIAVLTLLAGLALSLSRGAWIGTAGAAVFLLLRMPEARRALLAAGIPLGIAAALFWSSTSTSTELQVVGERARAIAVLSPYDGRAEVYREALREIRENPFSGVGPANFSVSSVRSASHASTVAAHHAHNLFLNWGAESGLPAVGAILGFIFAIALASMGALRASRRFGLAEERILTLGLCASLLALLGQSLVDYTLRNTVVHLSVWFVVGALLAMPGIVARSSPS